MMTTSILRPSYLDDLYYKQAGPNGVRYSHGAKVVGYTDPNDIEQRKDFAKQLDRRTGTPLLRAQRNAPQPYFYGLILSASGSGNAAYGAAMPQEKEKFEQMMLDKAELILTFLKSRIGVRKNGQTVECDLIAQLTFHPGNRAGVAGPHVHVVVARAGVTSDLDPVTRSLDKPDKFFQLQYEAGRIWNLALGKGIEEKLGWKCDYGKGRCEVVGVPDGLKEALGVGSRAKEIRAYLKAKDIEPTPQALAYAAVNTRPDPVKAEDYGRQKTQEGWQKKAEEYDKAAKPEAKKRLQPAEGFFAALWTALVVVPFTIVFESWRAARGKTPRVIPVKDVDGFLSACQKRSRKSALRGAVRAIRAKQHASFSDGLKAGRRGYKRSRAPRFTAPKRSVVVIHNTVELTALQKEKLIAVAKKNRWEVKHKGEYLYSPKRHEQQQKQEQQQQHNQGMSFT